MSPKQPTRAFPPILRNILCSIAACSLLVLFCRILSVPTIGVDEGGVYIDQIGFCVSLPLIAFFYFTLRRNLFLYSIPWNFPDLPPYVVQFAAENRDPGKKTAAGTLFGRLLHTGETPTDLLVFTLLFFFLTPERISPAAAALWEYFLPFLPAVCLLALFLLMILGTDLLAYASAEKTLRLQLNIRQDGRGDAPSPTGDGEKTGGNGIKGPGAGWIIRRCAATLLIWVVGGLLTLFLFAPIIWEFLLPMLSVGKLAAGSSAMLTFFLMLILAVLLLLPVIRLLRAAVKRIAFLRRLRRVVQAIDREKVRFSGKRQKTDPFRETYSRKEPSPERTVDPLSLYPRAKVKFPFLSLLFSVPGESFRIESGGKIYACKLLCSRKKSVALRFLPCGIGEKIHRIRIKRVTMFTYVRPFPFGFPGEDCDSKLLIILPTPKEISKVENRKTVLCDDNGDRVGDYRIYTGSAFLNALERDCLDR